MTTSKIDWKKRAKRNNTGNRLWDSACGNYRVVESAVCFGVAFQTVTYSAWKRVRVRDREGFVMMWKPISRHRKRGPAIKACEKQSRAEQ